MFNDVRKFFLLLPAVLFFNVSGANAVTMNELKVNKYDCSVSEVKDYMMKRTTSLRKETGIATWDDFKEGSVLIKTAGSGGTVPDAAFIDPASGTIGPVTGEGSGGGLFSDCPMFSSDATWEELDLNIDWNFSVDFGGVLDTFINAAKNAIDEAKARIEEELKKGICERIDFVALAEAANEKTEQYYGAFRSSAISDFNSSVDNDVAQDMFRDLSAGGSVGSGAELNLIGSVLDDSFVGNEKLLNIFDPEIEQKRSSAINKEKERQNDKLINRILGK